MGIFDKPIKNGTDITFEELFSNQRYEPLHQKIFQFMEKKYFSENIEFLEKMHVIHTQANLLNQEQMHEELKKIFDEFSETLNLPAQMRASLKNKNNKENFVLEDFNPWIHEISKLVSDNLLSFDLQTTIQNELDSKDEKPDSPRNIYLGSDIKALWNNMHDQYKKYKENINIHDGKYTNGEPLNEFDTTLRNLKHSIEDLYGETKTKKVIGMFSNQAIDPKKVETLNTQAQRFINVGSHANFSAGSPQENIQRNMMEFLGSLGRELKVDLTSQANHHSHKNDAHQPRKSFMKKRS